MAQPKTPPLSIRPGDVRLAKIDAYALKHGLKRHAAVLELLDLGLDGLFSVATSRPTPKPVPGSDAAKRKALRQAPPPAPAAYTPSGEPIEAKSFNPQPKKGKGK